MAHLLDTSILVRLADNVDPDYPIAAQALTELHRKGELLYVTAQNVIEFRNVATRPLSSNGLGLSPSDTDQQIGVFEHRFAFLEETPLIYSAWKALVTSLAVIGKQVHDARLVAVCHVHQVTPLLTFNVGHFARFATFGPGLVVVDHQDSLGGNRQ